MVLPDLPVDIREALGTRLYETQPLLRGLDPALPPVRARDGPDDLNASGETAVDQYIGQLLRRFPSVDGGDDLE